MPTNMVPQRPATNPPAPTNRDKEATASNGWLRFTTGRSFSKVFGATS